MPSQLTQNYFDLFGLPEQFECSQDELAARYRDLQSRFHPDRFSHAGAVERRVAAQKAALVNEAFRALKDPQQRAQYLLSLKGIGINGETDTTADSDFLMRQMALREALDEAGSTEEPQAALRELTHQIEGESAALEDRFGSSYRSGDLAQARETAHKMQFFKRLLEEVARREEMLDSKA